MGCSIHDYGLPYFGQNDSQNKWKKISEPWGLEKETKLTLKSPTWGVVNQLFIIIVTIIIIIIKRHQYQKWITFSFSAQEYHIYRDGDILGVFE